MGLIKAGEEMDHPVKHSAECLAKYTLSKFLISCSITVRVANHLAHGGHTQRTTQSRMLLKADCTQALLVRSFRHCL